MRIATQWLEFITITIGVFSGCLLGGMFFILAMKVGIELSAVILVSVVGGLTGLFFWFLRKLDGWGSYLNEINPEGPFTFLNAWRLLRKRNKPI